MKYRIRMFRYDGVLFYAPECRRWWQIIWGEVNPSFNNLLSRDEAVTAITQHKGTK